MLEQGFTIVELMVALVISLLASIGIYTVFNQSSAQQVRTSDTQEMWQQARIAVTMIERDIRMAGYGYSGGPACAVNAYYDKGNGSTAVTYSFQMQPILSDDPAPSSADTSDQITVLYSNSAYGGLPASKLVQSMPDSSGVLKVSSNQGFRKGDKIILHETGKPCSLLQVTLPPDQNDAQTLVHASGQDGPYNPPGGHNIFPPGGYTAENGANIYNLGELVNHQYTIDKKTTSGQDDNVSSLFVRDLGNPVSDPIAVARGIISLQVLYGLDSNGDNEVDSYGRPSGSGWFSTNASRIRTARIALLARTTMADRDYTSPAQITVLPAIGGNAAVNYTVPATDTHFRYQVFQTEIPLRNPILANQP